MGIEVERLPKIGNKRRTQLMQVQGGGANKPYGGGVMLGVC